jgi:protein-disulfide isomerase
VIVHGVLWTLVNRTLLACLALVVLITGPALPRAAEVEISADPAVTRGPTSAPVTIVEFSDYQ